MKLFKRKVLLTGASGSIGRKTFEELFQKKDKYSIRLFLRDSKKNRKLFYKYKDEIEFIWGNILNPSDVEKAIESVNIVIHLAGVIPIAKNNNPNNMFAVNVEGIKNLLNAIKKHDITPKFIFSSSIAVYGDRIKNPWIKSDDLPKPTPGDYYAYTKLEAEKLIQNSELDYIIFRLSYCASTDILKFHPALFRMPVETSIEIIGTDDVGKAIVNALERDDLWGEIFILGGGEKCRIMYGEHIADLLEIMGLGRNFFPKEAFATNGYHCGFIYSNNANSLLNFQHYTLQDFYKDVKKWIGFKRYLAPLVRWFLRKYFLRRSAYYKEYKKKSKKN